MFRVRFRARVAAILAISLLAAAFVAPPAALGAATFTVNTLADTIADDGVCSLREAITIANAGSAAANGCLSGGGFAEITFSVSGTIQLTSALPQVTGSMSVDGDHAIVVDGMGAYQLFRVSGGSLSLIALTLRGGKGTFGGAITNAGTFYGDELTITANEADYGAGAYHSGTLFDLRRSTVNGNAALYGGGIYLEQPVTISNTTFHGNSATTAGGAVYAQADVTLRHVTVVANSAPTNAGGGLFKSAGDQAVDNSLFAANPGGNSISVGGGGGAGSTTLVASAAGLVDTVLRDNGGPTKTLMLLATGTAALGTGADPVCANAPVFGKDQRGNVRPPGTCDRGAVQRDRVAPTISQPATIQLRQGASLSGTSSRAVIAWAGQDDANGVGVDSFVLQRQVNGGAWTAYKTLPVGTTGASATQGSYNVTLTKDKSYRYRVRAVDEDGNVSAWSTTPTVTARLVQQTSSIVAFTSGWTTASSTKYSSGSVKYTRTAGKSVRISFTGRSIAFVTTMRSSSAPKVKVYVDGVYQGETTLSSSTTAYRVQRLTWDFPSSSAHTIRLVASAPGVRLDVDAFAILR